MNPSSTYRNQEQQLVKALGTQLKSDHLTWTFALNHPLEEPHRYTLVC